MDGLRISGVVSFQGVAIVEKLGTPPVNCFLLYSTFTAVSHGREWRAPSTMWGITGQISLDERCSFALPLKYPLLPPWKGKSLARWTTDPTQYGTAYICIIITICGVFLLMFWVKVSAVLNLFIFFLLSTREPNCHIFTTVVLTLGLWSLLWWASELRELAVYVNLWQKPCWYVSELTLLMGFSGQMQPMGHKLSTTTLAHELDFKGGDMWL